MTTEMHLQLSFKGKTTTIADLPEDLTLADLQAELDIATGVPPKNQKVFLGKKGLVKITSRNANDKVFDVVADGSKVMMIGSTLSALSKLEEMETTAEQEAAKLRARQRRDRELYKRKTGKATPAPALSEYCFEKVVPLDWLPQKEKALELLTRLTKDRGVIAVLQKYKWRIGILTELDPASNTNSDHEGTERLLGLNRNKGQVIELRLRTDDYDGWRNYFNVRKVLCHELAHNVYSDHDDQFWRLCRLLEKEVVDLDPFGKEGNSIGGGANGPASSGPYQEWLEMDDDEDVGDSGGWHGGTYVLGRGRNEVQQDKEDKGKSLRELLQRAAERRQYEKENPRPPKR